MLPWFREHYRALNTGASYRWQPAPMWLPWTGHVEYRIWQRVLYLRGQVYNPFNWGGNLITLPPGVRAVNRFAHTLGAATVQDADTDDLFPSPWRLELSQGAGAEDPLSVTPSSWDSAENTLSPGRGWPQTLSLDGAKIAVIHNPDPGGDGKPIVP